MTDHELLDATRRGDREAFGLLVQRYQRMVEAAAFCATGRHDLVDDVVQDTFITAWCTIERLRASDSLRSWLYGIARNLGHKTRRKLGRLRPLDSTQVPSTPDVERASPLETLVERDRDREIAAAVARLPARYREPLVLFYYEHCTVKEVAATLAVHEDTAMQRLSRARRKLGEELAARIEIGLESKPSRVALAAGVLLLLPTRASATAPLGGVQESAVEATPLGRVQESAVEATAKSTSAATIGAWLAAHSRLACAMLATAVGITVLAAAVESSNAVAARTAARAHAAQPAPNTPPLPTLPAPWTSLEPSVADPDHLYRVLGVARLDPVEACAAGARQLVMAALGSEAMVERDGTTYFEPSDELLRIRDEAGARTGATCGGDEWPELYVICEGTLADIRDGTINCYPHDAFASTYVLPTSAALRGDNEIVAANCLARGR